MKEAAAFGSSIWGLVYHSDGMSYGVLITLACMSIISWSIFFYRLLTSIRTRYQVHRFMHEMCAAKDTKELKVLLRAVRGGTLGAFTDELLRGVEHGSVSDDVIDRAIDSAVASEETLLPFLATSAAVAPLLGLFGTVWGLVNAFMKIGQEQTTDITVVAPGISQALITTLAGLMVAIPALAMYNYLLARIRGTERKLLLAGLSIGVCVRGEA